MEKIVVINEKKYQEFKYEMKRENDYFLLKYLIVININLC